MNNRQQQAEESRQDEDDVRPRRAMGNAGHARGQSETSLTANDLEASANERQQQGFADNGEARSTTSDQSRQLLSAFGLHSANNGFTGTVGVGAACPWFQAMQMQQPAYNVNQSNPLVQHQLLAPLLQLALSQASQAPGYQSQPQQLQQLLLTESSSSRYKCSSAFFAANASTSCLDHLRRTTATATAATDGSAGAGSHLDAGRSPHQFHDYCTFHPYPIPVWRACL